MDTLHIALIIVLIIHPVNSDTSSCLPGCSCTNDTFGRALLCMEIALRRIPENIPEDFIKIRIENSHLTEIPRGSFHEVSALESLWLNFNDITVMNIKSLEGLRNLTELRLEGNKLRSVPWTAFQETPSLKILDLKHNRLDVLPEYALRHLPALTYLDLSFNQLTVVSRDVFLNWPVYHTQEKQGKRGETTTTVVVALHDNPWLCDCRLKGFVEFIKSVGPPIILMNSYLTCSGPGLRSSKFFHEIDLKECMTPVATSPVTNLTLPFRSNATLICLVKSRPDPTIKWTYGLKFKRRFAESQMRVDEETIRSQLSIPSLRLADGGIYTCSANNFIGNSSVSILLTVTSENVSASLSPAPPDTTTEESVYIDIRIAKQTVYGITLEWHAVTENPAETWYTIHFGPFDAAKKETVYIAPGINSYSVTDLLPVTKYEICVALKNRAPRAHQCVVFVTGSDVSELEQREKLIHIIVIVCAMVLAVPAGMYACTTESRLPCFNRCGKLCRKRRRKESTQKPTERQGTFDSLQATSDEGLFMDSSEDKRPRRRSDDKTNGKITAELY